MTAAKLAILLGAIVAVGVVWASPALANFESNNGTSKGKVHSKTGVPTVLKLSKEGSTKIECEVSGEWTLVSPHVSSLLALTWTSCITTILGVKTTGELSGCSAELEQEAGSFSALQSISSACVIKIPTFGCVIEIAPAGNKGLKATSLTNVGTNLEVNIALSSLTTVYGKGSEVGCKKIGIVSGKEAELKGTDIAESLKAV